MPDNETAAPVVIGSTEALVILGIDRSTLSRWVASGRLKPLGRLAERGAFIFDEAHVREVAAAEETPKEATA